ncbi:MAG TPA: hypothetical protein VHR35_05190 [Nocardioides sp.]|jgi:hypothetical protein|nr:hypothetical protein [Nocardioides sp.]
MPSDPGDGLAFALLFLLGLLGLLFLLAWLETPSDFRCRVSQRINTFLRSVPPRRSLGRHRAPDPLRRTMAAPEWGGPEVGAGSTPLTVSARATSARR